MAAGDFTASTSLVLQQTLESMFKLPTAVEAEFNHRVMTAKTLMEKQSVEVTERLEGDKCVGVKAFFLQDGQTSITYDGAVVNPSEDCTTPTGVELRSNSKTYDNNLYLETSRAVKKKCNNDVEFAVESAKAVQKAMLDIRSRLNKRYIELLAANIQANQYANVASTITAGTANRLEVNEADLNFELLAELRLLASNNKIESPVFLNGRNFFIDKDLAMYRRLNDNQRDQAAVFNDFDIHWDVQVPDYSIDSVTTRKSTFIVNPGQLIFWNTSWSTPVATQIDPKNNRWVWTMQDPELMYMVNGEMRRVTYEVEYTNQCYDRVRGQLLFEDTYFVRLYGGLDVGPTGLNESGSAVYTGIMEIEAVAGV